MTSELRTKKGESSFARTSRARARGPAAVTWKNKCQPRRERERKYERGSSAPVPSGSDSTEKVILMPYCSSHLLKRETMTSGL